jgi:hypothetical protein
LVADRNTGSNRLAIRDLVLSVIYRYAAGLEIALFGGLATAIGLVVGTSFLWATTYPGIPENADLLNAIYRISFGIGGPGYAVPFGLLAAGISIPAAFSPEVGRYSRPFRRSGWCSQLVRNSKRTPPAAYPPHTFSRLRVDHRRWLHSR